MPARRPDRLLSLAHLRFGPWWLAFGLALVGALVFGSLASLPTAVPPFPLSDKLLHLLAYAALMTWFAQLFRHHLARLALALGFVALGVSIEYLQGMTATRQFERLDMLANTAGVLLAWALSCTPFGRLLEAFERLLPRSPSRA